MICALLSVLWIGKFKFSKLVAIYGSFSACGLLHSLLDCLNYCHPVPFMCWNHLLMSWGNYLSSFCVGVLCVTLLLIHTDKHNAKTTAYIFSPLSFFCTRVDLAYTAFWGYTDEQIDHIMTPKHSKVFWLTCIKWSLKCRGLCPQVSAWKYL